VEADGAPEAAAGEFAGGDHAVHGADGEFEMTGEFGAG
jgi:hypothetical protein